VVGITPVLGPCSALPPFDRPFPPSTAPLVGSATSGRMCAAPSGACDSRRIRRPWGTS